MTTLLIDGNNLLIRAVKSMERVRLSANGVRTGPLLVFVNMLSKYVREVQPDRLLVCWDGGRCQHRVQIYAQYKAARAAHGDEESTDFALAKEFLTLCNIHHIEVPGFEADDLVAAHCHFPEGEIVILSGDKDFLQLLGPLVRQIRPTGKDEWWTAERVKAEMGCTPANLTLAMALCGDPGDGVPGVPGIGLKTACKLLAAEDWNLEQLLGSGHKRVAGYEDQVRTSLRLVNLRAPLPGLESLAPPPTFSPTTWGGILLTDLLGFLRRYELTTIKERLIADTLWKGDDGQVQRLQL